MYIAPDVTDCNETEIASPSIALLQYIPSIGTIQKVRYILTCVLQIRQVLFPPVVAALWGVGALSLNEQVSQAYVHT